jgi:hypothetical protein
MLLTSRRLSVEVAAAGTQYRGARFDWTGFTTQVVLDGRHRFCTKEAMHGERSSGGIGLCNEFGLERPVGFEEAVPGERFPKLGVGLLMRPDHAGVDHMRDYANEPFHITEQTDGCRASWTVAPRLCRGYAALLRKDMLVDDNRLRVSYHLENTGERAIRTTEYNHNFMNIDGHATSPDYLLRTSAAVIAVPGAYGVVVGSDGISWPAQAAGFAARWQPEAVLAGGFSWTLEHRPSRISVCEQLDRPPHALALWGLSHVICPELFVAIDLQAGNSMRWSRTYTFASQ